MMIPYIVAASCWALYAVEMQTKVHGKKRLIFVLAVNAIFCPICIGVAYWKLRKENLKNTE